MTTTTDYTHKSDEPKISHRFPKISHRFPKTSPRFPKTSLSKTHPNKEPLSLPPYPHPSKEEGLNYLFGLINEGAEKMGIPFKEYADDMIETLALINYNRKTEKNIREVFKVYLQQFGDEMRGQKVKTTVFQLIHHFVTHRRRPTKGEVVPESFQGKLPPPGQPVYLPHLECYQDLKSLFLQIPIRNIRLVQRDRKIVWEFVPNPFLPIGH